MLRRRARLRAWIADSSCSSGRPTAWHALSHQRLSACSCTHAAPGNSADLLAGRRALGQSHVAICQRVTGRHIRQIGGRMLLQKSFKRVGFCQVAVIAYAATFRAPACSCTTSSKRTRTFDGRLDTTYAGADGRYMSTTTHYGGADIGLAQPGQCRCACQGQRCSILSASKQRVEQARALWKAQYQGQRGCAKLLADPTSSCSCGCATISNSHSGHKQHSLRAPLPRRGRAISSVVRSAFGSPVARCLCTLSASTADLHACTGVLISAVNAQG